MVGTFKKNLLNCLEFYEILTFKFFPREIGFEKYLGFDEFLQKKKNSI